MTATLTVFVDLRVVATLTLFTKRQNIAKFNKFRKNAILTHATNLRMVATWITFYEFMNDCHIDGFFKDLQLFASRNIFVLFYFRSSDFFIVSIKDGHVMGGIIMTSIEYME